MSRQKYEIPLNSIYEDLYGPHVIIDGDELYLAKDGRGDKWSEFIQLRESEIGNSEAARSASEGGCRPGDAATRVTEIEELIHVLVAFQNRRNTGRIGSSRTGIESFDEFREDGE